jgi:hypothetical protein
MPEFDLQRALGTAAPVPHLWELLLRVGFATVLGALVAYRPWRRLMKGTRLPSAQNAQSQTIIAASGALMVIVIGDSIARAFGLVGLGSFIRFRSGIRDPRDAALLFVMIGIGMACGLGFPVMAAAGAALVCVILALFDVSARSRVTVSVGVDDPTLALASLLRHYPSLKVTELGRSDPGRDQRGRLVVEADLGQRVDAAKLRALLENDGVTGVSRVTLED